MDSRALKRFRAHRGAVVGAILVAVTLALAFVGPLLAPYDPDLQLADALDVRQGLPVGPNSLHWLGADQVGRDELSRLLFGGRVSLAVALIATAVALIVGTTVGIVAGFFAGRIDTVAMRMVDALLSLPFLLVVIAIHRIFESPSLALLALVLGGLSWTSLARVVRARTLQLRGLDYVTAARALGMSETRVLVVHVLPNAIVPAIVMATSLVAQMVIAESSMSFLGLGVAPPTSSWGSMLHDGQSLLSHAPRLTILPGGLILLCVFGFNLLGEGLRDAFDPRR